MNVIIDDEINSKKMKQSMTFERNEHAKQI